MKTSNKLLIGFFFFLLVMFAAVQFILYGKYKRGDVITGRQLIQEQFTAYHEAMPNYLSIQGFEWVRIIPSDTFYFEVSKDGKKYQDQVHRHLGDTLFIQGDKNITRIETGYLVSQSQFWQLIIHCPPLKGLRLQDADATLIGGARYDLSAYSFLLRNAFLSIGATDYPDTAIRRNFFHTVHINAVSGKVILNGNAVIDSLHIRLDKRSETNDKGAVLGYIEIACSPLSSINLTGQNFKKLKLITD